MKFMQKSTVNSPVVDFHHTAAADRLPLVNERNLNSFLNCIGKTIANTAHLQAGINRNYLTSLSLFPQIPDLILYADASFDRHAITTLHDTVQFATMGSFSKNGRFQFLCYYVQSNQLEESQVGHIFQ